MSQQRRVGCWMYEKLQTMDPRQHRRVEQRLASEPQELLRIWTGIAVLYGTTCMVWARSRFVEVAIDSPRYLPPAPLLGPEQPGILAPLAFHFLGASHSVVNVQTAVAVAAWLLMGFGVLMAVRGRIGLVLSTVVLGYSLTFTNLNWQLWVLTDGLTLSVFVAWIGALLATRGLGSGPVAAPLVTAAAVLVCGISLAGPQLLVVVVPVQLAVLVLQWRRLGILVRLAVLVLMVAGTGWGIVRIKQTVEYPLYRATHAINNLVTKDGFRRYAEPHLAACPGLSEAASSFEAMAVVRTSLDRTCPPAWAWLSSPESSWMGWVVVQPFSAAREFVRAIRSAVLPIYSAQAGPLPVAWDALFFPRDLTVAGATVVYLTLGLVLIAPGGPVRRPSQKALSFAVLAGTSGTAYVFAAWAIDGMETARHMMPVLSVAPLLGLLAPALLFRPRSVPDGSSNESATARRTVGSSLSFTNAKQVSVSEGCRYRETRPPRERPVGVLVLPRRVAFGRFRCHTLVGRRSIERPATGPRRGRHLARPFGSKRQARVRRRDVRHDGAVRRPAGLSLSKTRNALSPLRFGVGVSTLADPYDRARRRPARRPSVDGPLTCRTRGGDPGPAASTRRPSSPGATSAASVSHRPTPLGCALSGMVRMAPGGADRLAGHGRALAPARLRPLLALEVTTPTAPGGRRRCRPPDLIRQMRGGQPALGRAPHSRRVTEAGDRHLPGDRGEVPRPPPSDAPVPDLADVPHQPRRPSSPPSTSSPSRPPPSACSSCSSSCPTTVGESCTSTSPRTPPPRGRPSSSVRRGRGTHAPRFVIRDRDGDLRRGVRRTRTTPSGSRRSSPPHGRPGRIRSSNG